MPLLLVAPDAAAARRLAARLGLHGSVLDMGPASGADVGLFLAELARLRPPPSRKAAFWASAASPPGPTVSPATRACDADQPWPGARAKVDPEPLRGQLKLPYTPPVPDLGIPAAAVRAEVEGFDARADSQQAAMAVREAVPLGVRGINQHAEKEAASGYSNGTPSPKGGNSKTYLLARLKRDAGSDPKARGLLEATEE